MLHTAKKQRTPFIIAAIALVVAIVLLISAKGSATQPVTDTSSPATTATVAAPTTVPAPVTTTTVAPPPPPSTTTTVKSKSSPPKPKTPAPAAARQPASAAGGSVWDRLATCEAHNDWTTHTASGFSGGLQFADQTWRSYGGTAYAPRAWQASREAQIAVAEKVLASVGWKAWPACSRKLGLR